jgi:hypothetical protein
MATAAGRRSPLATESEYTLGEEICMAARHDALPLLRAHEL